MKRSYDRYTVEQRLEYQRQYYHGKMQLYREMLGNKCLFCGWHEVPQVLEFAHKIEFVKEFSIGTMMKMPQARVLAELKKCMLLCPTCHRVYDYKNRESRKVGALDALEKREVGQLPT